MRYDRMLDEEILALWYRINSNLPRDKQITKVQASRIFAKLKNQPNTLVIHFDNKKRSNEIRDIFAVEMQLDQPTKKKRILFDDVMTSSYRV
jgi:predicted amidophosphoribosyltransferase